MLAILQVEQVILALVVMRDLVLVLLKTVNVNCTLVTMLLSLEPILPTVVLLEILESLVIRHWSGDGGVLVLDDEVMQYVVLLSPLSVVVLVVKIIILSLLLVCVLWVIRKVNLLVQRCLHGNVVVREIIITCIVLLIFL